MAGDDGLLLNFAAPSVQPARTVVTQSRPKGGRWRDRLEQRRKLKSEAWAAQRRSRGLKTGATETSTENDATADYTAPPLADGPGAKAKDRQAAGGGGGGRGSGAEHSHLGSRHIVSSLFTKNPEIPMLERDLDQENRVSSNAVVDTSSFEGIGVDPDMIEHLKNKMDVVKPTAIQQNAVPVIIGKQIQTEAQGSGSDAFDVDQAVKTEHDVFIQANTQSFTVNHLRWLVLDEADRLLELGFEETLTKILALLDEKAKNRVRVLGHRSVASSLELPRRRINVLCSATLRDDVRQLANESLHNPKFVSATRIYDNADQAAAEEAEASDDDAEGAIDDAIAKAEGGSGNGDGDGDNFSLPSQLVQKAVVVPAKLRLVTLVAQLRNTFRRNPTSKVIVFLSCTDAVDFMFFLLAHGALEPESENRRAHAEDLFANLENSDHIDEDDSDQDADGGRGGDEKSATLVLKDDDISLESSIVRGVALYRLHGSMPQKRRTETFLGFSKAQGASVLFTTDVAARGLDLPNVTSIVQFDPPSGIASYLHRVGRTARLGRAGEANMFLLPSESKYLELLESKGLRPDDESMEAVLRQMAKHEGARKGAEWQLRAGGVQSMLERFVVTNPTAAALAKQAFLSSMRAYATHTASERHIFHIRFLHFGHLAKAFALRETPNQVAHGKGNNARAEGTKRENKVKREKELIARKKPKFKRTNDISEFAVGDISAYYGPRIRRGRSGNDSD
ncbi:ATP-dependent RNA helicase dbp7 [Coemansia sp. RSA 552]|nr:ATP-dependent RNA helicase dbp7 [Coemansia sp. RSA 552]